MSTHAHMLAHIHAAIAHQPVDDATVTAIIVCSSLWLKPIMSVPTTMSVHDGEEEVSPPSISENVGHDVDEEEEEEEMEGGGGGGGDG